jgi:putative transposase
MVMAGRYVTALPGSTQFNLTMPGLAHLQITGGRLNNRPQVSHPLPGSGLFANHEKGPTRRGQRRMSQFKSTGSIQRFLSVHDAIYNQFNHCPAGYVHIPERRTTLSDLSSNSRQKRAKAFAEWHQIIAA